MLDLSIRVFGEKHGSSSQGSAPIYSIRIVDFLVIAYFMLEKKYAAKEMEVDERG